MYLLLTLLEIIVSTIIMTVIPTTAIDRARINDKLVALCVLFSLQSVGSFVNGTSEELLEGKVTNSIVLLFNPVSST